MFDLRRFRRLAAVHWAEHGRSYLWFLAIGIALRRACQNARLDQPFGVHGEVSVTPVGIGADAPHIPLVALCRHIAVGTGQKERLRLCAADTLCVFRPIADRPLVALHRDRCDRLGDRRSIVVVMG